MNRSIFQAGLALSLLTLTACTGGTEATSSSTSTSPSPTASATSTRITDAGPRPIGESQGYFNTETNEDILTVNVTSVEPISKDTCTSVFTSDLPEGKELIRLEVTFEAGSQEALDRIESSSLDLYPNSSWGWVDADGYKIEGAFESFCLGDADQEPAEELAGGQKTRGSVVLAVPAGDLAKGMPFYEPAWAPFPLEWTQAEG